MSRPAAFAAQLLETSASAYAGYAASLLLERHPEVARRYAPSAMGDWKASLTQRVLELAAALDAAEPRLFTSRVEWEGKSFRARDMDDGDLLAGLDCLREVLWEELPDAGRDEAGRYLELAIEALGRPAAPGKAGLDPARARDRLALQYLQAALEGDTRRALVLVTGAVDDGWSLERVYLDVLLAAQREIGTMWHEGEVSIAEEHVVTTTTERAMSLLVERAPRRPATGKTVVAAAVAGNLHGLAVRALADFFEIAGWRSVCLGADVPATAVATGAVYFSADLLVLSAALTTHLKTMGRTIDAVRRLPDREVKILVGGAAFAGSGELWRRLGADGHAGSAEDAVAMGTRLVGLEPEG